MRTTIFLDVDGVLNPWLATRPQKWWADYVKHDVNIRNTNYRVWRSQELGAALASLDADIVWATTWNEDANPEWAAKFGWEDKPVAHVHPTFHRIGMEHNNSGKLECVWQWFQDHEETPFIWIDDMHGNYDRAWAAGEEEASVLRLDAPKFMALCITPDPHVGLTKDHIEQMEVFITTAKRL